MMKGRKGRKSKKATFLRRSLAVKTDPKKRKKRKKGRGKVGGDGSEAGESVGSSGVNSENSSGPEDNSDDEDDDEFENEHRRGEENKTDHMDQSLTVTDVVLHPNGHGHGSAENDDDEWETESWAVSEPPETIATLFSTEIEGRKRHQPRKYLRQGVTTNQLYRSRRQRSAAGMKAHNTTMQHITPQILSHTHSHILPHDDNINILPHSHTQYT